MRLKLRLHFSFLKTVDLKSTNNNTWDFHYRLTCCLVCKRTIVVLNTLIVTHKISWGGCIVYWGRWSEVRGRCRMISHGRGRGVFPEEEVLHKLGTNSEGRLPGNHWAASPPIGDRQHISKVQKNYRLHLIKWVNMTKQSLSLPKAISNG